MNIYFLRHEKAEDQSLFKDDFHRELTVKGKERLASSIKQWSRLFDKFDYIVSSPLTRAKQTASIVKNNFITDNDVVIDNRLACGSKIEDVIEIANSLDAEDVLFVGHAPDFSHHVASLISSAGASIEFRKGAIAKVSFPGYAKKGHGVLQFIIPPSHLN